MSSLGKKKPIEFELWVKVACPPCSVKKNLYITMPARGLPDRVRCFNCGGMVDTKDLFKAGREVKVLEDNARIKGIDK